MMKVYRDSGSAALFAEKGQVCAVLFGNCFIDESRTINSVTVQKALHMIDGEIIHIFDVVRLGK